MFLDQQETIVAAIKKTCLKLVGSYNIALIYDKDPKAIYAVINSGEMAIARDKANGNLYLCSDPNVLSDEFAIAKEEV